MQRPRRPSDVFICAAWPGLVIHTFARNRLQSSTVAVADPFRARNSDERMTIPRVANLLHAHPNLWHVADSVPW